ncbi:AraC family transcriptional regulator [Pseudomaricurvus alkylphenolicus]|uniref:helix-turn-helix transcriptional regulator n=1 Tax=Pseudomaricurvus alkylphenolicus TaxID=1306991 RepID=UPI001420F3F4|nr:AraC family transcriptional regulator [Pseudomaricurvus alkylphenolicus]NIB42407.1 AraC family transcriptional regulator [Pseudomaricurvus alkylphenolicus]
MIQNVGLPAHAYEDPTFPISSNQHLELINLILNEMETDWSVIAIVFRMASELTIEHFGVIGLAMKYAETLREALRVALAYPELSWGHSRIVVTRGSSELTTTFTMEQPKLPGISTEQLERLRCYCLVLDLVAATAEVKSIMGEDHAPTRITLPFPTPPDWPQVKSFAPCPIEFDAEAAQTFYPLSIEQATPIHASSLSHRNFKAIAKKLSSSLAEDVDLTEQVSRWLWAYTPPLGRADIAKQLAMSERTLARKLKEEGTSYKDLYNHVQTERAKNFLRNESFTVSQIAHRLGYSEPAVFTRAFATQTGLSPLKWRKKKGKSDNTGRDSHTAGYPQKD